MASSKSRTSSSVGTRFIKVDAPGLLGPDAIAAPGRSLASGFRMPGFVIVAERTGGTVRAAVDVAVRLMAATLAARTGAVVLAVDLVVPIDVPGRGMVVAGGLEDERTWPLVKAGVAGMVRSLEIAGVDREVAVEADRACVGGMVGRVVVGLVIDLEAMVCLRLAFDA